MAEYGETAQTVAANVARLRAEKRWTLRDLADRLPDGHGKISHASIGELERGKRRATVDELTSFAVAFGVSPLTLLMPPSDPPTDPLDRAEFLAAASRPLRLTGTPVTPALFLVGWLRGDNPPGEPYLDPDEREHRRNVFVRAALPWWIANRLAKLGPLDEA